MMNQTKKHTTGKKLLALLLALIMTVSLLPMSVFAAELDAEETPVVEDQTQQDAEPAQEPDADSGEEDADVPTEDDADAADDGIAAFAAGGAAVQADAELQYRIVHLDCGRKYFSVDYIKAVLKTMAENGFNQLELAFGNGGLRFVLNEMDIKSGNSTLYNSADVIAAIKEGNDNFYKDPNGNALTEAEMKDIIAYAKTVGVEIVPLLNMPGHMDGILSSSLFSRYQLSGSAESLDLNNTYAVDFSLALLKLYVDWFDQNGNSNYFNFGADEYGQKIQNPYIGTDKASVTYTKLISYMNDCVNVIQGQGMTARCFNDFVCYGSNTNCALSKTVQVCYWSNQWNSSQYYTTPDTIKSAGYKMINTNQKWYFVPSKAGEYGKNVVLNNFNTFDVTKYQNIKQGDNTTSTTYTQIPVGETNVGAMFCVWCDTPSVDVALTDVQDLIAAMAAANPNYFTKKTVPGEPETPVIKQDDKTVSDGTVQVAMGATTTLTLSDGKTATWSSSNEEILTLKAVSKTRAAVQNTNAVQVVPVATGTATVTAELDGGTTLSTEVTVTAAPEPTTVEVTLEVGQTSQVYEGEEGVEITTAGNDKVATANLEPFKQDGKTTRTLGDLITPAGTSGDSVTYKGVISTKDQDHFMVLSAENGVATLEDTTDINAATIFEIKRYGNTQAGKYYTKQYGYSISANGYYLYGSSTLYPDSTAFTWYIGSSADYSVYARSGRFLILAYDNGWTISQNWSKAGKAYKVKETPVEGKNVTNITFTGVKAGTTTYVIGDVTYVVTVNPKVVNVTLEVNDSVTFDVGNDKISESPNTDIAKAELDGKGTLTLTGVAVGGPAYCTVGGTRYVITVVEKSTGTGTPLYVDLWVTNHGVMPNDTTGLTVNQGTLDKDNNAYRVTITYKANDFNRVDGRLLSGYLPKKGTDASERNTATAVYWKTRYLPEETRQKTAGWTNKSGFGTDVKSGEAGGRDIERIRYYAGTWAYQLAGGTEWFAFTTASTDTANKAAVTADETGAQIAAYYLLETEVTKEVTTFVTDWPDGQEYQLYGVALDYCVKYQGEKTRNPSSYGKGKTTQWFQTEGNTENVAYTNGYMYTAANTPDDWKGNANTNYYRVINNIEAANSGDYEVYMITVTPSAAFNDSDDSIDCPDEVDYSDYIDTVAEKVIWAESLETAESSDMTLHSELQIGGEPRVNRVLIQRGTGMLVTYYVRAREKQDNLHVYYIDNSSKVGIYDYEIIPSTEKKDHVTFEHFTWDRSNIAGGFTNSDNWVYNNQGLEQSVEWDLAKLKDIAAKYKVSYRLVDIQVENGADEEPYKVLKLYYESNNSRTYVVDFGVPAKVERLGTEEFTKVTAGKTDLFADGQTTDAVAKATNGKLYVGSDSELYYQLTTMKYDEDKTDVFSVTYTYADESEGTYAVTFIPASNVYYEDDGAFIKFKDGQGTAAAAQWASVFDEDKTDADNSQQIAEVLNAAKNVYGTDPTYQNSTKFSLGRAHKVTVSADMVNSWSDQTDAWPTAEFTFKGTGFDVISLTDNKSGVLTYKVEKLGTDGNWTTERQRFVSNYYGYGYEAGQWKEVDSTAKNALYQLPVVKVDDLDYGTYKVTLTVAYASLFDKTGDSEYSFWLDGVRIYDPAGSSLDKSYAMDGEGWPKYIELHDELVKNEDNMTTLFIEGNAKADVSQYTSYGPNHEVYLLNGQSLAFRLTNMTKVAEVHIGAKAPMGHATLNVNGTSITPAIETATDMYYDITKLAKDDGTVIITNADTAGDSILSLTQLKVTYTAEPAETELASLAILSETEQQEVVQMVRAMYAPVEPEVFTPERFEASWNRSTVKVGQKATLTVKASTDVDAITVDGVTVTNYRTRTQRTGWGWNATKVTYREFTYTITAAEAGTLDYSVVAVNADGISSEPITAALTVQAAAQRPGFGGWLNKIFGRWF